MEKAKSEIESQGLVITRRGRWLKMQQKRVVNACLGEAT